MAPSSHALRPPPSINPAASHSNPHLSIIPSPTMEARRTLTPQPIQQSSTSPLPPPSTDPAIRFPTSLSRLQRSAPDVVRVRNGSVLSRGMIVKTDFWTSGRATFLPLLIRGAPNFRAAEPEQSLGIYGSAQPTVIGLKSILTSLGAGPSKGNASSDKGLKKTEAIWFCTRDEPVVYIGIRPFVLRDSENWKRNMEVSDREEVLEAIENRLKNDIIREGSKYGGLFMVHEETAEGELIETWISVDDVMTSRDVWESVKAAGYSVQYRRIPIMSDQNPGDNYLAQYLAALRSVPTTAALIFNCGMGVVRTTFAMSTAILIRRKQLIREGNPDPFADNESSSTPDGAVKSLRMAGRQRNRDMALLKLMHIFQKCLDGEVPINLLSQDEKILEGLRNAVLGSYDVILSLLSVLDDGHSSKRVVDAVIDQCDLVINLRDQIVEERIQYALTALNQKGASVKRAVHALERYFFLIAFASFINDDKNQNVPFNSWLQERAEIRSMLKRMNNKDIYILAPIYDLSSVSQATLGAAKTASLMPSATSTTRGGLEWAVHIVSNRSGITLRKGTILKMDQWGEGRTEEETRVRGVTNIRHVHHSSFFALSQPTEDGIDNVLGLVHDSVGKDDVTWINLREEPLIYINGQPFVLREEAISLRNMKSYSGISAARLEIIEDRLKNDILSELKSFEGKILLHLEQADGSIVPVFEPCLPENVKTLKEIMNNVAQQRKPHQLTFYRIPTTAEKSPDFSDIRELAGIIGRLEKSSPIVVNCQLGRGRSTQALVYMLLQQQWVYSRSDPFAYIKLEEHPRYHAYAVINNLLRVVNRGHYVKRLVDSAIKQASEGSSYDLLESIEETRQRMEQARNQEEKERALKTGLAKLRRYFYLILYASYLHELKGDTIRDTDDDKSFPNFVKSRPDFKTIENEIDSMEQSDFFSNLQKMSLPDRVDGAPNYRRQELLLDAAHDESENFSTFGCGMPTVDGLRHALQRMGAEGPDGVQVFWTSMREEPVLYISGRPHVLRLESNPLENVITTGVTTDIVENMENALKRDVLEELKKYQGRLLLHDEAEETPGDFRVTANYEEASPDDVLTPKEVFELMRSEGYKVDYRRLPVTDEQAPIPGVFENLHGRVKKALQDNERLGMVFNWQQARQPEMIGRTMTSESLSESMISWDDRDSNPYLDGEYKLILQLVGVLPVPLSSAMEAVQNLRKAVYDYKLRAESAEAGSDVCVFLLVYGMLIVFADYLMEVNHAEGKVNVAFTSWLRERREISLALSKRSLD
ncbi:hypothetical protein BT69DRAFT_1307991 [Atractiella rhizophila]|nr:hypothetical protein BT69DRAFT_1307991 [Atractiella rhizophila]